MQRYEVINLILSTFPENFRTYLEIGLDKGECFNKVIAEKKFGVDPNPHFDAPGIYPMGSNEFFDKGVCSADLNVIFIDGDHTFKQSLQDLINAVEYAAVGGFILLHDCNPKTALEASPEKVNGDWMGEVWKTMAYALRASVGLEGFTVATDTGIGIFRKTLFEARVVMDKGLYHPVEVADFEDFDQERAQMINLRDEITLLDYLDKIKQEQQRKEQK